MRKRITLTAAPVAAAGLALIAAGCGGNGSNGSGYAATGTAAAAATPTTLMTRQTNLGRVLVDSRGRTLYLFEKDRGMTSSCSGSCASIWPPLTSGSKPGAAGGLSRGKIALSKRSDGTMQVTYGGHPLYTYAGDAGPGDTKGEGLNQFGAEWYVLDGSGNKVDNG
jgi:predicted lipoprotein with Yx(FWY)xxD motif